MAPEFIEEEKDPQREITPTLVESIKLAIEERVLDLRVSLPCIVVKYDSKKQLADIQPSLKKKYNDGRIVDMPIIYNVPIAHLRAGNAFIHMPLQKGDNVNAIFSDRSLDKWLSNGGKIDPEDIRAHHLTDAVGYPGLYPFNKSFDVPDEKDIIIRNENTILNIKKNGHFQIINSLNEFVNVIDNLITILREAVVYTSTGPQKLRHLKFEEIQTRLRTFKEA